MQSQRKKQRKKENRNNFKRRKIQRAGINDLMTQLKNLENKTKPCLNPADKKTEQNLMNTNKENNTKNQQI